MKAFVLTPLLIAVTMVAATAQRSCTSQQYLQQQVRINPLLQNSVDQAEAFLNKSHTPATNGTILNGGVSEMPVIKIPVVVHILYYSQEQNITDAQVQTQIAVLNRDFRKLNEDTSNVPAVFKDLVADCRFEFSLATTDPQGRATSGIIRRNTSIQYFNIDDRIKSTAIGGDDAWDANNYLNIWTGNLTGGLLGYASPIGFPKDKDGVVIHYAAFGTTGKAAAPYDRGRTATHEIGHWLGLQHIWGDRYCGDDHVDDTPPQQTGSWGCPSGTIVSCSNAPFGNMYMNFMDLTYDACINLFTIGQRNRMRSLFDDNGPRERLLHSRGCSANPLPAPAALPIDSLTYTTVRIFPNPVQNTLIINTGAEQQLTGTPATVYNQLGQPVIQTRITKGTTSIPVRQLKEGVYYIRMGGKTYKVVKGSEARL